MCCSQSIRHAWARPNRNLPRTQPAAEPRGKATDEKATNTAKELLNVARKGLDLAEKTPAGADDSIWSKRVLEAELNVCGNVDERIAARESYLKRTIKLEEVAKRAFENGVGTKSDLLEAEYRRCEAAVQLESERAARTGRPK
jgi:hypothetical protein